MRRSGACGLRPGARSWPAQCSPACATAFEDYYFRCHVTFERHPELAIPGADAFLGVCQNSAVPMPPRRLAPFLAMPRRA